MANIDLENCPSCQILIARYGRDALAVCEFCGHLMVEENSCTCYTTQQKIKVLIYQPDAKRRNEVDIFVADGGVASMHPSSDGKRRYLLTDLYQDRLRAPIKNYANIWERLCDGKMYCEEYRPARVTQKVIVKVLRWLGFDIANVEIEKLVGLSDEDFTKRLNNLIQK